MLLGRRAALAAAGVGGAGEVEQVGPFGLVELQRAGEGLEHGLGDAGEVPALEAGVVVGADAGEQGDFFAAQAGHAPVGAVERQAGLLGGDPRPAGGQEVAHLGPVVHALDRTWPPARRGRVWQYLSRPSLSRGG